MVCRREGQGRLLCGLCRNCIRKLERGFSLARGGDRRLLYHARPIGRVDPVPTTFSSGGIWIPPAVTAFPGIGATRYRGAGHGTRRGREAWRYIFAALGCGRMLVSGGKSRGSTFNRKLP